MSTCRRRLVQVAAQLLRFDFTPTFAVVFVLDLAIVVLGSFVGFNGFVALALLVAGVLGVVCLAAFVVLVVNDVEQHEFASAGRSGAQVSIVSGTAARAVPWLVRALPAEARAGYAEEFYSELWDQAMAGVSHRGQLRYVVRQFVRALSLRRELKAARSGRRAVL